ncbi:hypothetical protein BDY24DRAFT_93177 [Mrakia frigida]|uniref:J domain-containing protein n=1 Tax=Mrakia frigida TaxID=29902 RepID=UPI003FCC168B
MHRSLPHTVPSRRSFASPSSPCQLYEFPRSPNPTLWQILGVKENASIAEVKAAYYDRVRTLHPDAQSSNDHHPISQKDRFHLLQTAYETLGNADKRASYIRSVESTARVTSALFVSFLSSCNELIISLSPSSSFRRPIAHNAFEFVPFPPTSSLPFSPRSSPSFFPFSFSSPTVPTPPPDDLLLTLTTIPPQLAGRPGKVALTILVPLPSQTPNDLLLGIQPRPLGTRSQQLGVNRGTARRTGSITRGLRWTDRRRIGS